MVGCHTDAAISRYVKQVRASSSGVLQSRRGRQLVSTLVTSLRLKVVDSHVLIGNPVWKMATEIDVLCQAAPGLGARLMIIEIKTTQYTLSQHQSVYKKPDPSVPEMRNRLPNSEYWHHQMQLAAMVRTVNECYSVSSPAGGYVLVSCSDNKVVVYPLAPQAVPGVYTRTIDIADPATFRALVDRPQAAGRVTSELLRTMAKHWPREYAARLGVAYDVTIPVQNPRMGHGSVKLDLVVYSKSVDLIASSLDHQLVKTLWGLYAKRPAKACTITH
jgi:hypothetical protein